MQKKFRISSALKDIIGRDLITNDFVAIFELVKNSFDAHASHVGIEFGDDTIIITDNGKGMSRDDIIGKWLFVAYSAKRWGREDEELPRDYRDAISARRGYAGNKGIGRFSCDRLGMQLDLYSRPFGGKAVQHLVVNWTDFELDADTEFATVDVQLGEVGAFPKPEKAHAPTAEGTMLVISRLRDTWSGEKIKKLRAYLAKLVNPFDTSEDLRIETHVTCAPQDDIEGPVGNHIVDLLDQKTAKISVSINSSRVETSLWDRGTLIYRIEEDNRFPVLAHCGVEVTLHFLNKSAKQTFTHRMGVQPVQFGNIFLFVNGFRVYPVGEPTDDTFGIGRRKQQGVARYLGLRDILGKIDVTAPVGVFQEASSRDAGLIEGPAQVQLYEAVMKHAFFRLERYAVTVNWVDSLDQESDDAAGLKSDSARARIIGIVKALAGSPSVRLLDYDRELIDIINERAAEFEDSLEGLALVAQEAGDQALLARIERSRRRYEELKQSEAAAKQKADEELRARKEAEKRASVAEKAARDAGARLERVEKQAKLLLNAKDQGSEELQLLHHQVIIYATEVETLTKRCLRKLSRGGQTESVLDDLEEIAFQNSKILAVTRIATQAKFKLNADRIEEDIVQYIGEYVSKVAPLYGDIGDVDFDAGGASQIMEFKPVELTIVLDNLFSNAGKAGARRMAFKCRKSTGITGSIEIVVSDDGGGIDEQAVDVTRIFQRGYSGSRRGSGLGLYHAKQVIEGIGGSIALDPQRPQGAAQFIIRLPKRGKK
ncbi:sensor histidine kinase [Caenispirillum bisanense]|uniref:histidine kinase n=1 Tax=Caenispirillum bisanense TaxID=414052 RepID=A0A286H3H2_9PROT|nr:sensor histidine kinase [Caenispirillum bisanense]SOE01834.1 Signal transduction histidine kinase [Caenispirillum bisanense]